LLLAGLVVAVSRPVSPVASAEREVDEELMLHLRSLGDDNLAAGMPPDEAWRDAQTRFGPLRHYSDACRRVTLADRLPLPAIAFAGLAAIAILVGWMLFEVRSLRQGQLALLEAKSLEAASTAHPMSTRAAPPAEASSHADLSGLVLDRRGEPLDGADVFVILKTWPGDRFRQQAFASTSGRDGSFRLPDLVPDEGQVGLLVAAVKDGHALTSTYQLRRKGERLSTDGLTLRLDDASRITLVVQDRGGHPVANARILPSARQSPDGENHFVYFQGSEPLQVASDAEGRVTLGCFERGDEAEIYLQTPGEDWQRHVVEIPVEGDVVTISMEPARGPDLDTAPTI
jgi:hypothetical protein